MAKKKTAGPRSRRTPVWSVELERTVPASPAAAERALEEVLQALSRGECACGDPDEIRIALREALNNALRHGSRLDPRQRIHVLCRWSPQQGLWLVVRDQGEGFDPHQVPDPTQAENLERFSGRGLHIIRQLMDKVEFRAGGREIHLRRFPRA